MASSIPANGGGGQNYDQDEDDKDDEEGEEEEEEDQNYDQEEEGGYEDEEFDEEADEEEDVSIYSIYVLASLSPMYMHIKPFSRIYCAHIYALYAARSCILSTYVHSVLYCPYLLYLTLHYLYYTTLYTHTIHIHLYRSSVV